MSTLFFENITLDIADRWCRNLYYDRLKTLDLKGKKVLELGCDRGLVTKRLVRDKDFYQYELFESVDSIKECIDFCREKIPNHNFIHACITSKNLEDFIKYDTYLIFYNYITMAHNEMINILRRLVNEFHKEVILYESLIDDFNSSDVKYNSMDYDVFIRLKTDPIIRISNEIVYNQEFEVKHKNEFVYLYSKK